MDVRRIGIACFTASVLIAGAALGAERDLRLIDAAKQDNVTEAKALAASGADVNARAGDGATALHWAAQNNDLSLVDLFIAKGAQVNAATDLGVTPLWIAASNAETAIVLRLLEARADPNLAPSTDGTPLMAAAQRGDAEAVKALLAHGADPNAKEASHGQTALMWAAAEGHPDVTRLLLAARADVRARTKTWKQRVMLCCQYFEGDDDGAAIVDLGGFTPLMFAAQSGDTESAKLILAAGADIKDVAADNSNALILAAHAGQSATAVFLVNAGADPNDARAGYTALHVAATAGDLPLVTALLAHGADPNARVAKGSATRQMRSGHAIDHRLIGGTPFILAACNGHMDVMKLLVAKGGDPKITTLDGRTAIMAMAGRGTQTQQGDKVPELRVVQAIKLAAELGTPVNHVDANGDTALHIAATRRRDAVVQALADSGAALNVRDHDGLTALAAALKPPASAKGSGLSDDYEYLLKHTGTAQLLRKLGATT